MRVLGSLALVAAVASSAGADVAPRPISLAEAVTLAQRNTPAVIAAAGQRRTSAAGVRSAWSAFIPSLSLSGSANRQIPAAAGRTRIDNNGQVITLASDPWSYGVGLGASVDLFDGGRRIFDLHQAEARVRSAAGNEVAQRYAATLAVKQQFFNVLAARESEDAARTQLTQAQQQLHSSVLQLRAKKVTRSDSLRSEIQVRTARIAILDAHTALLVAEAALTRAVGSTEAVTAAPDSAAPGGLALEDDALRALAGRGPDVIQAEAEVDAAKEARRGSWSGYLPSVSASYSRSGNGSSSDFTLSGQDFTYSGALRLSLSFPIFNQYQREAQLTSAQVTEDNARASLRDAQLAARENVTQWLGTFHSAEEKVSSQVATVAAAEEDLRVQRQRYGVGRSTLLDVLTSQTALDQARRDLIRARFDQRVAKAQLEALAGRDL